MAKRGRPRKGLTFEVVKEEIEQNKLTVQQIAEKYGVSDETVRRRMKEAETANKLSVRKKNKTFDGPDHDFQVGDQVELLHDDFSEKNFLKVPIAAGTKGHITDIVVDESTPSKDVIYVKFPGHEKVNFLPHELRKVVPEPEAPPAEPKVNINGKQWLLSKVVGDDPRERYFYNKEQDTYITFLRRAPEPIVVSGPDHRAMCQAYSDWDGNASSINEICRQFSFPRPWLIEYKHVHGWTHDREPFSAEELMEKDVDSLVDDAFQMKRQALYQKFEERKWQTIKADALKWQEFQHSVLNPLKDHIIQFAPSYRPQLLSMPKSARQYALAINPMDLHFGKGSWRDETGHTYSREQAKQLLLWHTEHLLKTVLPYGRPEKIIFPVGSDWFHVDNPHGTTTRGTPQDMDGTPGLILKEGCELAIEHIDMARQIAPVELVLCDGNHDQQNSLSLLLYIHAWYHSADDVKVRLNMRPRQYMVYGNTLLGWSHGNDVARNDLANLMAVEAREDWGKTEHRAYFTGHLHAEMMRNHQGIRHYQVASLSGSDRWHDRKGYVTSDAALSGYVVDSQDGVVAHLTSPVNHEGSFGFKIPNRSR